MWCKQRHHETIIWNKQLCVSYKIEHDCFQMNWTSVECVCFVHVKVTSLIMYLSARDSRQFHTQRVLFWFWARFSSFSDDLRAPETHIRLNAIDSAVCEYYSIGVAWCQNLARICEILASTMANSVEKCCCLAMACPKANFLPHFICMNVVGDFSPSTSRSFILFCSICFSSGSFLMLGSHMYSPFASIYRVDLLSLPNATFNSRMDYWHKNYQI